MKKLYIFLAFFISFFGCKNNKNEKKSSEENKSDKIENVKKITKRDFSINASNSYSDLFLDSSAVESFISTNKLNDTLSRRIRSFYNARNYQFAWFSKDGVTEQGRSFWNLHEYYTTYNNNTSLNNKALKKKMNSLISIDTLSIKAVTQSIANTEIALTQHFSQYILNNYKSGEIKRKELERFVPFKKVDALFQADSLLTKKHKDNKYYSDVNTSYKLLKDQLQKYYLIAKNGGWQRINANAKKMKKGDSSLAVLSIKKRLQITGEMSGEDTTHIFNDQLVSAVKTFEISRGLTPNGVVTSALIKEMNVPALKRVEQLLISMDRMRWSLNHTEGNLITVNLPEFVLHVYEGKSKKFDMNVVVGKEGHNTTIFTGNLNQIVFSPYWNIPANIVENEILPSLERDPDYLIKNEMEETGEIFADSIPIIRQLPGPKNSLGKVKFLFPNSFDIYFHDTPAKGLFNQDKRAYSHGCIRLSDPAKMATYLLRTQEEWTPEKIDEAMNSSEEQIVKLKNPVPVLITYYTAWVDEKGMLNFRDDIYGHDASLAQKMFTNPF